MRSSPSATPPRRPRTTRSPIASARSSNPRASSSRTSRAAPPSGGGSNSRLAREELLHLVHEALGARVVAVAIFAVDVVELAQELLLPVGEAHRGLDRDLA